MVVEPADLSIFALYFGPIRDCQTGLLVDGLAVEYRRLHSPGSRLIMLLG